jgi:glycine cleavage system H protein
MTKKYYTKDHEWLEIEGNNTAVVGITQYAQEQLGDVVFVELPAVGKAVKQQQEMAVVESVKAASEVYAPLDGTVAEINAALVDNPALINSHAENDGWFVKLTLTNPAQLEGLFDKAGYEAHLEGIQH